MTKKEVEDRLHPIYVVSFPLWGSEDENGVENH